MSGMEIIFNRDTLTDAQNLQFRYAIMEGLKGKLEKTLDDDKLKLAVQDVGIKHGFHPMDETFSAIDKATGEVQAILLLNNFKEPGMIATLHSMVDAIRVTGIRKALKYGFAVTSLSRANSQMMSEDVVAEIFLISTREAHRGKGVGTALLKHALEYVKERKCKCGLGEGCTCKVMLLVFNKNPAKRLYERLGFTEVKSVPTPKLLKAFGDDYDVLIKMERPLKAAAEG